MLLKHSWSAIRSHIAVSKGPRQRHLFPYPTLLERDKNTTPGCLSACVGPSLCVADGYRWARHTSRKCLQSYPWMSFLEHVQNSTTTLSATHRLDRLPKSFWQHRPELTLHSEVLWRFVTCCCFAFTSTLQNFEQMLSGYSIWNVWGWKRTI